MDLFFAFVIFVIGIVLLIKCGDWFVDAASWIARAIHIPPFIVGATIVSFATTMPEMIVSLLASIEGKNEMAVGNAIGSVSANTGLIMAIAFLFLLVQAPRKNYLKQCLLLIVGAIAVWVGCLTGSLQLWASILLLIIFILFMIFNIMDSRREQPVVTEKMVIRQRDIWKNIAFFIIGAVGIVVGSNLLINGGSTIATSFGVPERVIAVTMVAVGTSLPELVTTITAIRKKEASLSVGNVIGANVIDLSLILPVCSFVSGESFTVSAQCLAIDFPACLLISLLAIIPLMIKQRSYKWQGIVLLLVYFAYIVIGLFI